MVMFWLAEVLRALYPRFFAVCSGCWFVLFLCTSSRPVETFVVDFCFVFVFKLLVLWRQSFTYRCWNLYSRFFCRFAFCTSMQRRYWCVWLLYPTTKDFETEKLTCLKFYMCCCMPLCIGTYKTGNDENWVFRFCSVFYFYYYFFIRKNQNQNLKTMIVF